MTTLTMKDKKRLDVIQRVYRSELTVTQAALVMGLSERQCYWVKARVNKVRVRLGSDITITTILRPCSSASRLSMELFLFASLTLATAESS